MNINELTHEQLNNLAALGQGWRKEYKIPCKDGFHNLWVTPTAGAIKVSSYDPCNNGSQAIELLKGRAATLHIKTNGKGLVNMNSCWYGAPTPTLAIVRAFVASKYGTEIDYDSIIGEMK